MKHRFTGGGVSLIKRGLIIVCRDAAAKLLWNVFLRYFGFRGDMVVFTGASVLSANALRYL